jgi:hypothetical protein
LIFYINGAAGLLRAKGADGSDTAVANTDICPVPGIAHAIDNSSVYKQKIKRLCASG